MLIKMIQNYHKIEQHQYTSTPALRATKLHYCDYDIRLNQ